MPLRKAQPLGFAFSLLISKTILEKQEGIKPFSAVTHPPAAPTTLSRELQEMPWSSRSAQGHPWSQRQSFKTSSQAVLLTTLSLINCVYSGATKDGWRSANPLPRKIFSTEIIVIKSEGKHWQKLAENQHVHLSEGCGAEKKPLCWHGSEQAAGRWTACTKICWATTWFSKQLCGAHVMARANCSREKQASVLCGCTERVTGAHFHSFRDNATTAGRRQPQSCWQQPSCYCGPATSAGQEREVGTKSMRTKGSEWKKHKCCQNA